MKLTKKEADNLGLWLPEKKRSRSDPEQVRLEQDGRSMAFLALCEAHGLPRPDPEYPFCEGRKWRFDYLFEGWLALEVEGGVWTEGRHTRGEGFLNDVEKYNEATILGYSVIRCTPKDLETGAACALVRRAIEGNT